MEDGGGSLFASLMIGSVGFALFVYGKKQTRPPHLVAGGLLMLYPYFVPGVLAMLGIGVLIVVATWVATRHGY